MATEGQTEPTVRPFAAFLQELRGGRAHAELGAALSELVQAVEEHGEKGTLRLELTIKPEHGQMLVTDHVVVKAPSGKAPTSIWFADDAGNLLRDHPTQQSFDGLREVPALGEAREIPSSSQDAREAGR